MEPDRFFIIADLSNQDKLLVSGEIFHLPLLYIVGKEKGKTMSDILEIAEIIVRKAGGVLKQGYGNVRHIQQKGVIDLVTEFDLRSEEIIISALKKEFPDHAILAEESGLNTTISEYQ